MFDDTHFTFDLIDPEPDTFPVPLSIYINWLADHWSVEAEAYTAPDVTNPIPVEDKHLRFLLDRFALPYDLLPLRSVETMSPAKLKLLHAAITELGGVERLRRCFATLAKRGVEIEGYIGGGGWGHVFRASSGIGSLAIKFLKPPYNEEWRRRFQKESDILHKVSGHRGIARLIAPLEEVEELLILQMALVKGTPLIEERLPIYPPRALSLIRRILTVLNFVHSQSIVHRDLHLGNVLLAGEEVVLLDFGLARDEGKLEYYHTFKPVGAMSHCAPEKWADPSSARAASDIFSVGVMLYKLLTGEPPFWADTYIRLYEQIKAGAFKPASDVNRDVPDFLDLVLQEMLYPSLNYRLPHARAALDLLHKIDPTMELWERQRHIRVR